jgi:glutaredoxin
MIRVFQAEWCPYSSQVRQKLTELQVPYVAMPVPAEREDRERLRSEFGTDEIPVVVLADGTVLDGDAADIVRELDGRFSSGHEAAAHRHKDETH